MKNMAVVLSGCGHRDGAELTESISTLIALGHSEARYAIFAPNIEFKVTDAITGKPTLEKRNVLQESARIARGEISDIENLRAENFDGLVFPGGFGAALHLCTFATDGAAATVLPSAERVIKDFFAAGKPIGAHCISPALLALVLGRKGITVTIGNDKETATQIEKTGAHHENCAVDDFVTDRENKIVTTPAYMYDDATPAQAFAGISKAIRELVEMA
jgi:enhancing lycopene biosynthesis protein 2